MIYHISELVRAQEHNYHFHPCTIMNGDVLISMSVESDGKWMNWIVAGDVLRFCFCASSDNTDLMGEDRNGIIDWDGNNTE